MKIAVVGTGYVGLVTGTCLAETGNDVCCVDIDAAKIKRLKKGDVPIYEPNLEVLLAQNSREKRLSFTTNLAEAVNGAAVIFLALPTPQGEDGSADLSYILSMADELGHILKDYVVIVDKSTVPVGTAQEVQRRVAKNATAKFDVVSNPEFLREGQAVADFLSPDRIIVGASSERAREVMTQLYLPYVRKEPGRLIMMDEASAEMTKYAANGFLATKISFVNELAGLCEATGADIELVRQGMGSDSRIGDQFLYAGPGYGGSCFPKDTAALKKIGQTHGQELSIISATIAANDRQKQVLAHKVIKYFSGNVRGKTFGLWGLAFKDNTDDVRESPALEVVKVLTAAGAKIMAFDPQAMGNVKKIMGHNKRLSFADDEYSALQNADALIIATNWKEFDNPDFSRIKKALKNPVIFDGRNRYDLDGMGKLGFYYESIGRRIVTKA